MSVIYEALKKAERDAKPLEVPPHRGAYEFLLVTRRPTLWPIRRALAGMILLAVIGATLYQFRGPLSSLLDRRSPQDAATPSVETVATWLYEGQTRYGNGDIAGAIVLWEKALPHHSDDPILFNRLGLSYKKLGKLEKAIGYYDRALALNADYAQALSNKGAARLEEGFSDDAQALFQRAAALDSGYADPFFHLGRLYETKQQWPQALEAYRTFLARYPEPDSPIAQKIRSRIAQLEQLP